MKRYLLLLVLALTLLFGCQSSDTELNKEFTAFTNQLFIEEASADALTLNYTLENPDDFGITKPKSALGTYSYEDMKKSIIQIENYLDSLQKFKPEKLPFSQRVLYDTLSQSFHHALEENSLLLYNEILGPTSGMQAQLPVLLCEYRLSDKKDLENYFSIIRSIPAYFESVLDFERKRAENQTYTNASTISNIIFQCKDFIKSPDKNVLISNFNERMKNITFLSNNEKRLYIKKNKEMVMDCVIKAYQTLILGLETLQDKARSDCGLCSLKEGRNYYRYLVESQVGTLRSIEDIWVLLEQAYNDASCSLYQLALKDPSLFSLSYQLGIHSNTPSEILKSLEKAIETDFPPIPKVNYEVKYIDSSLEDYLSPAFYLSPPLDKSNENVIYINGATRYENTDLFPTLAHEGYPGHLYQSVFQNTNQTSPLQGILSFGGYSEGWATYAELYSYKYAGLDENICTILRNNTICSLALTSLCDIGIHYKGWTMKDTVQFLFDHGIKNTEACEQLYKSLLDEPASYLKYSVGYLEIIELKKKAEALLGKEYTDKKFHTYILSMGPTWFSILDKYMADWFGQQ